MIGYERIMTVLEGGLPDQVPNFPLISFATARLVRMKATEYYSSAAAMTKALIAGYETYGYDGITVGGDLTVEAEALGMQTEFPEHQAPQVRDVLIKNREELRKLSVPDPTVEGRMPMFCEVIRHISDRTAGEAFIKSTTTSPFVLAGHLLGIESLMMLTVADRDFFNEVLAFCADVVLDYATAQCDAGAHAVGFGAALASPDLISPKAYIELVQPHEKKIIEAIHERGCKHVIHICGNSLPIIGSMAEAGADIIDIDQKVDVIAAKNAAGGKSTVRGNLDPSKIVQNGSPQEVFEAARDCIENARDGGYFILAPGCTVGYDTPPENIHILKKAIEMYGRY